MAFELGELLAIRGLVASAVVEVDESEEPVAGHQGESDCRLDLVAPNEGAVDLGWRIPGDQLLSRHREPHRRAVVVNADLVWDLALAHVTRISSELLTHVGQRVEQALLR